MRIFDLERFKKRDFSNAEITNYDYYGDNLLLYGNFAVGDIPYFNLGFQNIPNKPADLIPKYLIGLKITRIEVVESDPYKVGIAFDNGEKLDFLCKRISIKLNMYRGKSYKNVYSEWRKELEKCAYVECDEYFKNEESIELSEGYLLNVKSYMDMTDRAVKAELCAFELTKNGEHVYSWRST